MNLNLLPEVLQNGSLPSELKQPFSKECIYWIEINIRKSPSLFTGNKKCGAVIRFQNGDTNGEQRINDDDFDSMILRLKSFCDNL